MKLKSQWVLLLINNYIKKIRATRASFTFPGVWESGLLLMSLANLCTEFWAKLGGEAHVRSEFRHVYITAQDISQSLAKLPKFPGSRESAEKRHKCSLFLLFLLLHSSGISVIVQLHLHCNNLFFATTGSGGVLHLNYSDFRASSTQLPLVCVQGSGHFIKVSYI